MYRIVKNVYSASNVNSAVNVCLSHRFGENIYNSVNTLLIATNCRAFFGFVGRSTE